VTLVQRELFEASLQSAHTVLELMGLSAAEATTFTDRFRKHNIALADRMYPHHKDQAKYIAVAREGRAQLAEQMAKERQESAALHASGAAYPGYGGVEDAREGGEPTNAQNLDKNRL
jgi:glutathione-regulated potassium-efflux system ancillary protein KefC